MMTSSILFMSSSLLEELSTAHINSSYTWELLKTQLKHILLSIPSVAGYDSTKCQVLIDSCIKQLDYLKETPFTIQRICELLLMLEQFTAAPEASPAQYTNFEKYLNALYKCLNVTGKCDDPKLNSKSEDNSMDMSF